MKCPCCGAAELIHDTRDLPYTYKGETTTIPAVTGDFCPACGEVILNREHGNRYSELLGQFQRQVNAAIVDPDYLAKVQEALDDPRPAIAHEDVEAHFAKRRAAALRKVGKGEV